MIKNNLVLIVSIVLALFFWFLDSFVHYFGYGEPEFEVIPTNFNELWMRLLIVILMLAFGVFASYRNGAEKKDVHKAMVSATHHILNNFLQKMFVVRQEAETSKDFDEAVISLYDEIIDETTAQIKELERIQEPTRKNIESTYRPR